MENKETVNHPDHYNEHLSGVECIDIIEEFSFNIGNAIKYLWRHGKKNDRLEELNKAKWYVEREIIRTKISMGLCESVASHLNVD